jgi:hypothetical protein
MTNRRIAEPSLDGESRSPVTRQPLLARICHHTGKTVRQESRPGRRDLLGETLARISHRSMPLLGTSSAGQGLRSALLVPSSGTLSSVIPEWREMRLVRRPTWGNRSGEPSPTPPNCDQAVEWRRRHAVRTQHFRRVARPLWMNLPPNRFTNHLNVVSCQDFSLHFAFLTQLVRPSCPILSSRLECRPSRSDGLGYVHVWTQIKVDQSYAVKPHNFIRGLRTSSLSHGSANFWPRPLGHADIRPGG